MSGFEDGTSAEGRHQRLVGAGAAGHPGERIVRGHHLVQLSERAGGGDGLGQAVAVAAIAWAAIRPEGGAVGGDAEAIERVDAEAFQPAGRQGGAIAVDGGRLRVRRVRYALGDHLYSSQSLLARSDEHSRRTGRRTGTRR